MASKKNQDANALWLEYLSATDPEDISWKYTRIIYISEAIVFNTCLRFLKNEEEAKDQTQEIFLKLFENRNNPSFRTQKSYFAWLHQVTKNHCLQFRRKRTYERLTDDQAAQLRSSYPLPGEGMDFQTIKKVQKSSILAL